MAAGNVARIIRAPGRVVIDPTDAFATGTYPYGGTEVGKTTQVRLQPLGTSFRVEYESLGEAGDLLEPNKRFVFACFLRGWDNDAVEQLFGLNFESGSVTQHKVYAEPGTSVPGASALTRAVKVAYIPDDPIHVPGLLIYRGIPEWTDGAELAFQRGTELGIPLTIECLRDGSGNILRMGRMPDISLS